MSFSEWDRRLRAAIEHETRVKGRSLREISASGGLKPNHMTQFLNDGKEPRIENFLRMCDGLGVSPVYILTGAEIDPEAEKLLRLWASASPRRREAFLVALDAE